MGLLDRLKKKTNPAPVTPQPPVVEPERGPILGFVLLDECQYDFTAFIHAMLEDWNVHVQVSTEEETLIFEVDGMKVVCGYIPAPIPDHEVEECAKRNFLWAEAEQITATHKAQIILSVMDHNDVTEAYKLFTKAASSLLKMPHAIALYMHPMVHEASYYIEAAKALKEDILPIPLWVYIGMYRGEQGRNMYTSGLKVFGKDEIEVIDSQDDVANLYEVLFMIVSHVIENNVSLKHGETIGFSENHKLDIKRSQGVAVEGYSLKIDI